MLLVSAAFLHLVAKQVHLAIVMEFPYLMLLVVFPHFTLPVVQGTEPFLVFSTWFHVSRMNLDSSEYSILIDSSSDVGPQAIDYHPRLSKIYWTHYRSGTVHEADLDGSNPSVIISNVTRPKGLAVDWLNDVIYFSFGDFGTLLTTPNHLAVYNISSGVYTEITTVNPQYYDIAVDPKQRKLYWTTGSRIIQSSLSGENAEVIHTIACFSQYLALIDGLFFTETCSQTSQSVYFLNTTSHRETIIYTSTSSNGFYSDVTAYGDNVYWTALGRVYSVPSNGNGAITELLHIPSIVTPFRGIILVQPDYNIEHKMSHTITKIYLLPTNTPTSNNKDNSMELAPMVGGILGASVAIISVCVFLVMLFLWIRKKQSSAPKVPNTDIETSQNPVYGIPDKEDDEVYEVMDPVPNDGIYEIMESEDAVRYSYSHEQI